MMYVGSNGRIIGNFVNTREVRLFLEPNQAENTLSVEGNFTQTANGMLRIYVYPTKNSQLHVSGNAQLAGGLNYLVPWGFRPANNATYTAVTYQAHMGEMANVPAPAQPVYRSTLDHTATKLLIVYPAKVGSAMPLQAPEGTAWSGTVASFTDPGRIDPVVTDYQATIHWGDGTATENATITTDIAGGFAVIGSHTYAKWGSYAATVTVEDVDNPDRTNTWAATASIYDVAPTVTLGNAVTLLVGDTYTSSGSFADPGDNTWTATVDYGDGTGPQPLALNPDKTFTLSHAYPLTEGTYTVSVTVTDDFGMSNLAGTQTTVSFVRAATSTSVSTNVASVVYGQAATLLAAVTSLVPDNVPFGDVWFYADGNFLGAAPLDNGTATLTTSALEGGSHWLTATFQGSSRYQASFSMFGPSLLVTPAPTTTTITGVPATVAANQTFAINVLVTSSVGSVSGNVAVTINGLGSGFAWVTNGVGSAYIIGMMPGTYHMVVAVYSGSSNYQSSSTELEWDLTVADASAGQSPENYDPFGPPTVPTRDAATEQTESVAAWEDSASTEEIDQFFASVAA